MTLSPEREKEIRDYVGHAFNRRATNVCLTELLAEIDHLRAENEKLKHSECLCPACGTDFELQSMIQCRTDICDKLAIAREALLKGTENGVFWREEALAKLD